MAANGESRGVTTRHIRVLVVDDHPAVRRVLIRILADHDLLEVVGEAGDGEQAIQMARTSAPDVVLMDYRMPGINGAEATRRIKAENPAVTVIGLSAGDEMAMADSMRKAGASRFVTKDLSTEKLVAAIHEDAPSLF